MQTYFEQSDEQNDGQIAHVHAAAAVQLLSDVFHALAVAWLPKHSLCGGAFLPQQHQQLLMKQDGREGR